MSGYLGRFAPSPTGPLHAGSLVAALASWLDARAHGGKWLVRIEDVDTPRCVPQAAQEILRQLAACGLISDEAPVYQSQRALLYQEALAQLIARQAAYPCACSRKEIEAAQAARGLPRQRHAELIYPGTCRLGLAGRPARAWRFRSEPHAQPSLGELSLIQSASDCKSGAANIVHWHDRRLGAQSQNVAEVVGDFVLRRADGLWAYQLAVVVDDAAQGITHIVRGEDLADNTARQIRLQQALGYPPVRYLHTPLVLAADGQKLSKQNGAEAIRIESPSEALHAMRQAACALGLSPQGDSIGQALQGWTTQWGSIYAA